MERPLSRAAAVALAAGLAAVPFGCVFRASEPPPDPEGVVRIAPLAEDEEEKDREPDAERMRRSLERRFPGVAAIDFARLLVVPESRSGTCWTEAARPWQIGVDVDWTVRGEARFASGVAALKEEGWWPTYRSPDGFGIERRARFEALDVRLGTRFSCRCIAWPLKESEWQPLEVRFRWKAGKMPEASAAIVTKTGREVIAPKLTYGHLLTWEFEASGALPPGEPGRCGLRATLAVLGDPPIL